MGNQVTIPEEISARFATCELESIQNKFQKLADEGSFRHKTFDKKTFQKYYFTSYPSISELLFNAFDRNGNNKVEFEDFISGLVLIRGSLDEKIFFMFKMFRLKRQKAISIDEFRRVTSSGIFAGKKETREEKKIRVTELGNEVFKQFDKDKDKQLSRKEFTAWASQSLESTVLLDLFKKLDNLVVSSGGISGPTNVIHDTHVAKTDDGGFSIDNIPSSWVELFKSAGVTEKELQDPKTAMMLMGIVADKITNSKKTTVPVVETKQPINPVTEKTNKQPTTIPSNIPAPPPITNNTPKTTTPSNIPTAPPISPTVPLSPVPPVVQRSSTSSLLSEIRAGTNLKHVAEDSSLGDLSKDDKNDLTNVLMRAINDHRKNLKIDYNSDDDDDGWDD